MPKFARPNSYNGKQSNQSWTGQTRAATEAEAAAGLADQLYISPATLSSAVGDLVPHASTTTFGLVQLTDNSEPVATKLYADSLVASGAPIATTTQAGISQLATDIKVTTPDDGGSTLVNPPNVVRPSNLVAKMSSPGTIGNTLAAAATFTALTANGTGAVSLGANAASDFTVTGAFDLSLASTAGSINLTAGESATDSINIESTAGGIKILASGAAAGEDIVLTATGSSVRLTSTESATDSINIESTAGGVKILASGAAAGEDIVLTATGSSIRLTSTESATDSINIESTLGGVNILASGASAGEDINITATGSSVNVNSTENAALAIFLHADGGTSETIVARADQGTGDASVQLLSDVGGITLTAGKASATAINLTTTDAAGGITISTGTGGFLPTTTGKFTVISTSNTAQAIELHANGGTSETIRLRADQGTAATSLDLLSDVGGITLNAGLGSASAINITSSAVGGGWTLNSGTAGVTLANTGKVSLAAAAASDITVTGAFDLTLATTLGRAILQSGKAAADAVKLNATNAAGGITMVSGTAGTTLTNTGALSLAGSGASNITIATGDLSLIDTASSIILNAGEAVADAIQLNASNAAGGIDVQAGTGGLDVDTTGAIALDAATASNFTVTGAADLTLQSTAGAVNLISGEANLDSINISSGGGMSIVATGAAAKDILITSTSGSMTLSAGENVTDALNFTAGGAASRINLTAGTGSIKLASGLVVKTTALSNASTPYTVLGTDYFLACDTSAGVLTVTLPAATALAGRTFVIRDVGGAVAANNITINGGGTNLVGGGAAAATKVLSAAYSGATVYSDGTVWAYSYVA